MAHEAESPSDGVPVEGPLHASRPSVTIVVVSVGDEARLSDFLAVLAPQCRRHGATLVVARAGGAVSASLAERWPEARFLVAPPGADVPHLRGLGLAVAVGDIVAFTDDRRLVDERWIETLVRGCRR